MRPAPHNGWISCPAKLQVRAGPLNKSDNALLAPPNRPMEQMTARIGDCGLNDPLGYIKASAMGVLLQLASDERMQRVFDIVNHKCEYVDEMKTLRKRHHDSWMECIDQVETGFRNAIRNGSLPRSVNARRAARGMHALIDGIIVNWLLNRDFISLTRDAEPIIDCYLLGLGASLPLRKSGKSSLRRSVKWRYFANRYTARPNARIASVTITAI